MVSSQDLQPYQSLIDAVESKFLLRHPACQTPIRAWRGKEIIDFQEDLLASVQGRISEKWFYTHIRQQQDKIPRIDILNMLCQYAGYPDWASFVFQTGQAESLEVEGQASSAPVLSKPSRTVRRLNWRVGLAMLMALGVVATLLAISMGHTEYTICFLDADTRQLPANGGVEIVIWEDGESLRLIPADAQGCVHFSTEKKKVKFTVSAPYYLSQTIERNLDKDSEQEVVLLEADDYALMLHYFSESKVEDWKKRRSQLEEMFDEDAKIVQVAPESGIGVEMYNKQEFIDRMTLPIASLRNLEVLQTEYHEGKIVKMRFLVIE